MSQDYNSSNSRRRRTARSQRNRPVLVPSPGTENSVEQVEQNMGSIETTISVAEPVPPVVPKPAPTQRPAHKLPRFFSTVGKSQQETSTTETDVAQARIARATRNKVQSTPPTKTEDKAATPSTTTTRPTAAIGRANNNARPTSPFKTRYIIGMGLYLLAANFIGIWEQQLLKYFGQDRILTTLDLFGSKFTITTSTLLFLTTLVIILVLLARFDLIPRNLGGPANARRTPSSQNGNRQSDNVREREPQPTMRQGVTGADDDLYQQYRANQRREKKR